MKKKQPKEEWLKENPPFAGPYHFNARKIDPAKLLSVLLHYQAKMNEEIIDYIKKNQ